MRPELRVLVDDPADETVQMALAALVGGGTPGRADGGRAWLRRSAALAYAGPGRVPQLPRPGRRVHPGGAGSAVTAVTNDGVRTG